MMTMGKKFKKSMAIAMATTMAFSIPVLPVYQADEVKAATSVTEAEATSTFDSTDLSEYDETLAVFRAEGDDSDVLYYAVTTKDKSGNVKTVKESAYEAVDFSDGYALLDLSWISRKKEQVLLVTTGTSISEIKPKEIELQAQDTVIVTYQGTADDSTKTSKNYQQVGASIIGDDDNGYLTFGTGDKKNPTAVSASAIQYRTTNGNWEYWCPEDTLDRYSAKGTTLQMRVAPVDGIDENGNEIHTPAGKIVNVKIKAKGKAPSVTVNYNDKTVSVPRDVSYSVNAGTSWSGATDKKESKVLSDFGWNGSSALTVYFRTAGDSKKAASKIKYLTIKSETTDFNELDATATSGASVIGNTPSAGANKIDVRYKTPYDNTSGLVFTNATSNMYQVALIKKSELTGKTATDGKSLDAVTGAAILPKTANKVTWATVSAQDTTKGKVGTGKLALRKGESVSDYVILYRIADKKGTTINSQTKIFDMPGTPIQSVSFANSEVTVTSGAGAVATATVAVSASGITSTKAKYTVDVYSDEACTTKDTNVKATYSNGTLTITTSKKSTAKTSYVKISVEGASAVLKVTVTE